MFIHRSLLLSTLFSAKHHLSRSPTVFTRQPHFSAFLFEKAFCKKKILIPIDISVECDQLLLCVCIWWLFLVLHFELLALSHVCDCCALLLLYFILTDTVKGFESLSWLVLYKSEALLNESNLRSSLSLFMCLYF